MKKIDLIKKVESEINNCQKCRLSQSRLNTVPGEGNLNASIMIIGEGPGKSESEQGRPFVGRSGELLNSWLMKELNLKREDVYITNIVKCRPPNNRDPKPDEVEKCISYLNRQIEIIKPKIIITLGRVALQSLFNNNELRITRERGRWRTYNNIPVLPTFHPAFYLRQSSEANKKAIKSDLLKVAEKIK
ncbi:hypothetical protein LCGC14_1980490 [marine sediment metagenome]|uniref:Type-4 uracil-DNA glycosylase n=1 Tax=marine sediment metagenome TaxID=412755 RepID=A0A0F9FXA9_9ZZZZ